MDVGFMIYSKVLERLKKLPHFLHVPSVLVLWPLPTKITSKMKLSSSRFNAIADPLARVTFAQEALFFLLWGVLVEQLLDRRVWTAW
jgi:hypothetical protein